MKSLFFKVIRALHCSAKCSSNWSDLTIVYVSEIVVTVVKHKKLTSFAK